MHTPLRDNWVHVITHAVVSQRVTVVALVRHDNQGRYIDAVTEVLNPDQKTFIHIPSVNSGEPLKVKYGEVDRILDALEVEQQDVATGIILSVTPAIDC